MVAPRVGFKVYEKIDIFVDDCYLWSTCAHRTLKLAKARAAELCPDVAPSRISAMYANTPKWRIKK